MIDNGWTTAQLNQLIKLQRVSHRITVTLSVLDLNHNNLGTISNRLMDGQVDIDCSSDGATRSMTLTLLDPSRSMNFDSGAPEDGALFFDRMIRATVTLDDMKGLAFSIPVFTGPVTKVNRESIFLKVECQGKETLSLGGSWTSKTYKAPWTKRGIIENALRVLTGETKFDLAASNEKVTKDFIIAKEASVWTSLKDLARSMGMNLFYDARGVCVMRGSSNPSVFTFDNKMICGDVQITYDTENMANAVQYTGGKPKGSKTDLSYRVAAPSSHPFSPQKLGRNGVPRYITKFLSNGDVLNVTTLGNLAKAELDNSLLQAVGVTFDSLPMYLLEEYDVCRCQTEVFASPFRVDKLSLPLTVDGLTAVGYNRRVKPSASNIRVKR